MAANGEVPNAWSGMEDWRKNGDAGGGFSSETVSRRMSLPGSRDGLAPGTRQSRQSVDERIIRLVRERQNTAVKADIAPKTETGYLPGWPVVAGEAPITGRFGETRGLQKNHTGIDIAVPVGTPVVAVTGGKYYKNYEGEKEGFGKYVCIVSNNGITTYYAHLRDWAPIANETEVPAGTTIGWSGNSGNSTGPHLHYEVRGRDGCIDPLLLINAPATTKRQAGREGEDEIR